MAKPPSRRDVLLASAGALALGLTACDDPAGEPAQDAGLLPDAAPQDATADAAPGDAGPEDAAAQDAAAPDAAAPDAAVLPPGHPLSKGPWMHWTGVDTAQLRFETVDARPWPVTLIAPDGSERLIEPARRTDDVGWRWAHERWATVDRAGSYTLHTATLAGITPGLWRWRLDTDTGPIEGSLRRRGPDEPWRILWVADSMWPISERIAVAVAEAAPDLILHGGDLQYRSNPGDTWNGFFSFLAPALRHAPIHACVGNHEYETPTELEEMYGRLLGGVGEAGGLDHHALTVGPLRVILINSEAGRGTDPAQLAWLDAQLSQAGEDPAVKRVLVGFHRPYYTFSKHSGALALREALHPRLVAAGVDLVFCGHVHAYERFLVDGITYIVDGGGGAGIYDPNEDLEEIRAARPEEIALRQVVSATHGFTILEVASDGGVRFERVTLDQPEADRFALPPRA